MGSRGGGTAEQGLADLRARAPEFTRRRSASRPLRPCTLYGFWSNLVCIGAALGKILTSVGGMGGRAIPHLLRLCSPLLLSQDLRFQRSEVLWR